MTEIWGKIKDYPNYEVSNEGRVRNIVTGKVLRPAPACGYQKVDLYLDGVRKQIRIHRLVATAFIPNPDDNPCVNHIDGDKTNNCISNLEWVSYSENTEHAYRTGLHPRIQACRCIETGQTFESQHKAGKYFGCGQWSIHCSIHKGHKVKGKYHFEPA